MKSIPNKYIVAVFFLVISVISIRVQASTNDSIKAKYPFIKTEKNRIEGDTISLMPFFEKLSQLHDSIIPKVSVLHIGDSHIQADFFPGMVRQNLQLQFGNAGRGLIAPFKVARTNEPSTIRSSSNTKWNARRMVNEKDSLPIGISGVSIATEDFNSQLKITTFNKDGIDNSFSKITLFHQKGLKNYNFNVCDSLNCFEAKIDSKNDTLKSYSIVKVKPCNTVIFNIDNSDTLSKKNALIYGMLLENEKPGVLYNMIGINGAEFRHYNKNARLLEQIQLLTADLIIISLGTNEAFSRDYNNQNFHNQIDSFVTAIKLRNPNAVLLLTTLGDSNKRVKYQNPNNNKARKVLIEYCETHQLAYWDWYQIMGGTGAINKWALKHLTARDRLHLNRRGYELQGLLLYEAIQHAYSNYLTNKGIQP